jgi:DNA replication and repair protein RecF
MRPIGFVVSLLRLELHDFRSFSTTEFVPDPEGTTVITGANGTGKTSLLEAVAYLATQRSFRGTPRELIVRRGCDRAIVRADLRHDELPVLVEAELQRVGRSRLQVNRQPVRTRRSLAEAVQVTVFSPDDLAVVRGGPNYRRELLDDALRILDRQVASQMDEVDRVLRQRAALLRQSRGRTTPEVTATLDVWDQRLAEAGTGLADARDRLARDLQPLVADSYGALSTGPDSGSSRPADRSVTMSYSRSWSGELAPALFEARDEDLRRAVTSVGPHRDELVMTLEGRDTRHQASQGEQRTLAIALRLSVHRLVVERTGRSPILLLDDVFSELDPARSRALIRLLPQTQALLTTAVRPPGDVTVAHEVDIHTLRPDPAGSAGARLDPGGSAGARPDPADPAESAESGEAELLS